MKRPLALALAVLITTSVVAQTPSASAKPKTGRHSSSAPVSKTLEDMKDAISSQQQQIQQLQQQIQSRDQAIQQLQQQVTQAQSTATQAQQAAAANQQAPETSAEVSALQHDVTDLKTVSGNAVNELQETQKRIAGLESPAAIHYKGVTITPGGFLAGETYYRNHGTGGEATPFNSIPFPGSSQSSLGEFYGSGRQSRLSLLVQGKAGNVNATGYYEADFLSAGVTSNNNATNSYTLRQRQAYVQAALANGWTFTGGQMWSLVTETRVGVDNRTEATPLTIDPNYTVGFSFARQYGFRVSKNFHNKVWLAGSVENAQATIATSSAMATNFLFGSAGAGGGLYNATANYSYNLTPDFIAKAVFEPGVGHYEIFGIMSVFRDRVFPGATLQTPTAAGAYNSSTFSGGFGANARFQMMQKRLVMGAHFLGGNGIGRYGASGLPDVTLNSNGTIAKLRNAQVLGTVEWHGPKWDVYMNAGAEYEARRWDKNAKGVAEGYGSPLFANYGCSNETLPGANNGFTPGSLSNCSGNTRNLIEGTFGFWYKPYNGPKGRIQIGPQYSYIVRNTWVGYGSKTPVIVGDQPSANDSVVATSFRYYLP